MVARVLAETTQWPTTVRLNFLYPEGTEQRFRNVLLLRKRELGGTTT